MGNYTQVKIKMDTNDNNTPTLSFDEKKEMVIECYCKTYDKELAYAKCSLTEVEIDFLNKDKFFQERLVFHKAEHREKIINELDNLSRTADKDATKLNAIIKLGEIVHPEVFVEKKENEKVDLILPVETQKRLKDIFASGSIEIWKNEMMERLLGSEEKSENIINEIIN